MKKTLCLRYKPKYMKAASIKDRMDSSKAKSIRQLKGKEG